MAQRIAPISWGGASVWDVQFEIKEGKVDLQGAHRENLARMYWGTDYNRPAPELPEDLTWVDSMRGLLSTFQRHIESGTSVFYSVPSLYFLKLSLAKRTVGEEDRYFFCFSTQFHDPSKNEQEYIDDMFQKYGFLMEPVWYHCKGVTRLLENLDGGEFQLWEPFLKLVDERKTDNTGSVCFFVANRDVSPSNIKTWEVDSVKLGDVSARVGEARVALAEKASNHEEILGTLMTAFDDLDI